MKYLKNPRNEKQVYKILKDNIELLVGCAEENITVNVDAIKRNIENQFKGYNYTFDLKQEINQNDLCGDNFIAGDFYLEEIDVEEKLEYIYSKIYLSKYLFKKDLLRIACEIISDMEWNCDWALSDEDSLDVLPLIINYDPTFYTDIILPKYWLIDTYIYSLGIEELNQLSYNEIMIDYKLQHNILTSEMTFSEYFNSDNFKYWLEGVLN